MNNWYIFISVLIMYIVYGQSDAGTNDATSRHSEIALTDKPFLKFGNSELM